MSPTPRSSSVWLIAPRPPEPGPERNEPRLVPALLRRIPHPSFLEGRGAALRPRRPGDRGKRHQPEPPSCQLRDSTTARRPDGRVLDEAGDRDVPVAAHDERPRL